MGKEISVYCYWRIIFIVNNDLVNMKEVYKMDIIRKHTDSHVGNCLITDTVYLVDVFGEYIVGVIRKYDRDNSKLDFRSRKEFNGMFEAIDYYKQLIANVNQR